MTLEMTNPTAGTTFRRMFARVNWEVVAYLVIFALAIFSRFVMLGDRVMSHDESLHTRYSYNLYADGDFTHTPLMHGPILFHMTALSYFLFGDSDFAARVYPAILGVLLVLSPLLFRRWLGRWGAVFASFLLLISPITLYYNRYIRHDTPSILFAVLMLWGIMMYTSGPVHLRRKAYWLYLIAAAMILNLGSKETAFIYIFIFGVFLFLYWLVRVLQQARDNPDKRDLSAGIAGKRVLYTGMLGVFLGGVAALGLYIAVTIVPIDRPLDTLSALEGSSLLLWLALIVLSVLFVVISTVVWVYRDRMKRIPWLDVIIVLLIAFMVATVLLVIEERSHHITGAATSVASLVVPDGDEAASPSNGVATIAWWPLIALWIAGLAVTLAMVLTRLGQQDTHRLWRWLDRFPEFDVIVVIGTLILPWATALIPFALMKPTSAAYLEIATNLPEFIYTAFISVQGVSTQEQVGQVVLALMVATPMLLISTVVGLAWNWRRWLVSAGIFYAIFVFFFTTIFTNSAGLGTGLVHSLGYWLEQQEVRRGNQPQYYYLLIQLPFYEFLPMIGGSLAMFTGTSLFWRWRRSLGEAHEEQAAIRYAIAEATQWDAAASEESPPATADLPATSAEDDLPGENDAGPVSEAIVETLEAERHPLAGADLPSLTEREVAVSARVDALSLLTGIPFLVLVSWWAILNLVFYSLAGEKMPWLTIHLTYPLILLTGWFLGRVLGKVDARRFFDRGWLYLLLVPLLLVTGLYVLSPIVLGGWPFQGLQQTDLERTFRWLAMVALTAGLLTIVFRLVRYTGLVQMGRIALLVVFGLLSVLTIRSAWMASYINYDLATEFLVYAHSGPAIKWVLDDIEDISLRTTGGHDLKFVYDDLSSWPYSWYFRNYPNAVFVGGNPTVQNTEGAAAVVVGAGNRGKVEPILADRYYRYDYVRMWWPMQDYFGLNAERVNNLLDFSPENTAASALRQGLFDIWWSRDYQAYGEATGKDFSLANWPVADRMHFYVRKDIASQIWPYGVGEGLDAVFYQEDTEVNLCSSNWLDTTAMQVIEAPDDSRLVRPLGMDLGPDGQLYVADEYGHRVAVFDENGVFVTAIGEEGGGPGQFQRPNSVRVGDDGRLYVADTWNYRVQILDSAGIPLAMWGQPAQQGYSALTEPDDGFWGPRDVTVDAAGNVHVSDTGNKRVRVYAPEGSTARWLYDIGSGGSGLGQLDEPAGLAIHPGDDRLFVADTWNRRVSTFLASGEFIDARSVPAWYDDLGNRPYMDLDTTLGQLYVTDPDSGRVLILTLDGQCLGAFGRAAGDVVDNASFATIGGITVADDGRVYVADAARGRILVFPPFVLDHDALLAQVAEAEAPDPADGGAPGGAPDGAGELVPLDVGLEETEEVTAEAG
jgi:predicted membrane-bound mannosyltransferase/DNA-binding beta-propeller fold protein YncE